MEHAKKRDIFKINSDTTPTAINLEHVTMISVSGKKISFSFYNTTMQVDFSTEQIASDAFNSLLNVWVGDLPIIEEKLILGAENVLE